MNNTKKSILIAIGIIIVAALGSLFTALGQSWFASLQKPAQWPPDFIFPIVWSAIYIVAFFSLRSAFEQETTAASRLLLLALINGGLNILWCLAFFTLHLTLIGVIVIVLNLAAAVLYTAELYRKTPLWAFISLIYPLWITIAFALNLAVWILQ